MLKPVYASVNIVGVTTSSRCKTNPTHVITYLDIVDTQKELNKKITLARLRIALAKSVMDLYS